MTDQTDRIFTANRSRTYHRRAAGSMFSMTALLIGLALFACIVGFGFYLLMSRQKVGQYQADQASVLVAQHLNENDQIGQMNNVVARCRELVFVSRMNEGMASEAGAVMQPLANQLLQEARDSAIFVENERQKELHYIIGQLKDCVDNYNVNTRPTASFSLPGFQTYDANIDNVECGYVNNVQCNVLNLGVVPQLRQYDQDQGYFQAGSNLYKGNINARLPGPDADLNFKLSSLPADVEGSTAPPRLANPEVFRSMGQLYQNRHFSPQDFDQLPSAVRMTASMQVFMKNSPQNIQVGSTALTSGGQPAP